jgi:4-amino-4-deoxychorismate lyase
MLLRAWVNGTTFDRGEEAVLSVMDRGLMYGDGLFESIRIQGGRLPLLPLHLTRLKNSAAALGIACDFSRLERELLPFIAGCGDAVVKIILTRGMSGRGYLIDLDVPSSLLFTLHPAMSWPVSLAEEGVKAVVCRQAMGVSPLLAGHKHLNRLEQVLLRQELASYGDAHEAIVSDVDGHVVEGVFSNLFWVRDGVVHTPCLDRAGVRGVMRQFLIEQLPSLGLRLHEGRYPVSEVLAADEIFFCNSLYGIWPVRQMEEIRRQPGPITRRLQQCRNEKLGAS